MTTTTTYNGLTHQPASFEDELRLHHLMLEERKYQLDMLRFKHEVEMDEYYKKNGYMPSVTEKPTEENTDEQE